MICSSISDEEEERGEDEEDEDEDEEDGFLALQERFRSLLLPRPTFKVLNVLLTCNLLPIGEV